MSSNHESSGTNANAPKATQFFTMASTVSASKVGGGGEVVKHVVVKSHTRTPTTVEDDEDDGVDCCGGCCCLRKLTICSTASATSSRTCNPGVRLLLAIVVVAMARSSGVVARIRECQVTRRAAGYPTMVLVVLLHVFRSST